MLNVNSNEVRASIQVGQARRIFWFVVLVTGLVKLCMARYFPITGDEAFFDQWANFPGWGYYDHPPMIGWWLWILHHFGDGPVVIRSATVALTTVISFGVVYLAKRLMPMHDEAKAWLAGAVYLSLPVSWYGVFVTTDTPLIFFTGVSIAFYVIAIRRESAPTMFLSGVFLGLAFLSKYFAVLLGLAFGIHLLFHRKRFQYIGLLLLGVLPLAAINVIYNATHCWNNIMFNLVNRNEDAALGWHNLALFLAMMIYLISPWATWRLIRNAGGWRSHRALSATFLIPMGLFLLLSLEKTIGLHWVLGFLPVAFVMLAACTPAHTLKKFIGFNALLGIPHLLFFGALMFANPAIWPKPGFREDVRFHRYTDEIVVGLTEDMPAGAVLTTMAYSPAALLSYHYGHYVPVFGPGKYHARNDDVFVDWRTMAGKAIRIVSKGEPIDPAVYQNYLSHVRVSEKTIAEVPFYIVDGDDFNYEAFRNVVLREAAEKYYKIPKPLPVFACPFGERYGFEKECRVGDMGVLKGILGR